ncbi:2-hydroxychromene-2-carboxylate isomerase [Telmatospirillum siberiense]|uniref:2-hydroxychromene-2-carboxylate isomerase n=1 Tax=Telmatospirillum siberiense TaxID=382514 RepID=A0A2N3PYQ7_9PROT|nr:2-hydroxychromene-2-carboxylate isomerase [Telmatospirillum siberiense]PKU25547.1 2-hydroxychromene-2-carboxylate isomerase [Telmatospirillum siberiense]
MVSVVEYFFALNSPWSYLGSARLAAIAAKRGAQVAVRPIKLGAVFSETGGVPLAKRSSERQAYRLVELQRWSRYLDLPLILEPRYFPADETAAAHLVIAAESAGFDALALAGAIGAALWNRNQNIADWAVLDETSLELGIDVEDLRQRFSPEELSRTHDANTRAALDKGIFGVPAYVLNGEVFWGQDRLDFLDRALASIRNDM